jgi:hypothetical protein
MAVRGDQVEGIGGGIEADAPTKGSFALNLLWRRNAWETRSGFGQVGEIDTTMGAVPSGGGTTRFGYRKHLGSHLMITNFGHEQIISVFVADVFTGDRRSDDEWGAAVDENALSLTNFTPIYIVSIYDLTTDEHWEEPIYNHTSTNSSSGDTKVEMDRWHANYETAWTMLHEYPSINEPLQTYMPETSVVNHQSWIRATVTSSPFYFSEVADELFFGNRDTGLLAYLPSVFRGFRKGKKVIQRRGRERQVNTVNEHDWSDPYGESSMVVNAVASDGPFSTGLTYMNKTEFPTPAGATTFLGRLAMFVGNVVFFSDIGYPASVISENQVIVPAERPITAIAENLGNLIIFTEDEVWYYQPSQGVIVSTGRLIRIDHNRGCINANSVVKADGGLVWMDRRGCHLMRALSISTISDAISPFFTDHMTNPLTNFFTKNGNYPAEVPQDQQLTRMSFDPSDMSATYCTHLKCILWAIPANDMLLYFREGMWAVWTLQTMANTDLDVHVQRNIRSPWVGSTSTELFMVGSYHEDEDGQTATNQTLDPGSSRVSTDDTHSRPYYVMRYERGGSVDRSVELGEDYRSVVGRWRRGYWPLVGPIVPAESDHFLYIGKPIPLPYLQALRSSGEYVGREDTYMVPIDIVCGSTFYNQATSTLTFADFHDDTGWDIGYNKIEIRIWFDKVHWTPLTTGGGGPANTNISFALAPAHLASFKTTGLGGTSTWKVTRTTSGGVASESGDFISIVFDSSQGAAVAGSWSHWPFLNTTPFSLDRLLYIPFGPTQSAVDSSYTVGMGFEVLYSYVYPGIADEAYENTVDWLNQIIYIWDESKLGTIESEDNNVAQPIDWAYRTQNISVEGDVQIKGRGINIVGVSHGMADTTLRLVDTWPYGLLNCISGSDLKEWSSQVIDVVPSTDAANTTENTAAVLLSANKTSIRTRFKISATATLAPDTYTHDGILGPRWGSTGEVGTNYIQLVDDEEVSLLNISDGIRGESIAYMLWGHLQNKAEKLVIESAKVVIRVLGGRRRTGR